eukprot:Em0003g863a
MWQGSVSVDIHLLILSGSQQRQSYVANWVAEPAVTLASSRTLDCSVDVTDKSKAAGLPRSQLGTRTSAGRD